MRIQENRHANWHRGTFVRSVVHENVCYGRPMDLDTILKKALWERWNVWNKHQKSGRNKVMNKWTLDSRVPKTVHYHQLKSQNLLWILVYLFKRVWFDVLYTINNNYISNNLYVVHTRHNTYESRMFVLIWWIPQWSRLNWWISTIRLNYTKLYTAFKLQCQNNSNFKLTEDSSRIFR